MAALTLRYDFTATPVIIVRLRPFAGSMVLGALQSMEQNTLPADERNARMIRQQEFYSSNQSMPGIGVLG